MDCIYIALSTDPWPPKRFTHCLTLTYSYTHSYTDHGISHGSAGVLLMDTSTLGQVEPGIDLLVYRQPT